MDARDAFLGSVVSVSTPEKVVALTFDDGPSPVYTPRLLDVLARHGAKATFFMLGAMAERHSEIVRQVVDGGHEIGNHSWDHLSLPTVSRRQADAQISRARSVLRPHGQQLFRPPFGHLDISTFLLARYRGYRTIGWSALAEDWLDNDAYWISDKLKQIVRPGMIVLLHDSLNNWLKEEYRDRTPTVNAVDMLLECMSDYRFVTVSELMACGRPVKRYWFKSPEQDFLSKLKTNSAAPYEG